MKKYSFQNQSGAPINQLAAIAAARGGDRNRGNRIITRTVTKNTDATTAATVAAR
jgi:hypothetical protein